MQLTQCWFRMVAATVCGMTMASVGAHAEETAWQPVFSDDFDRPALGTNWVSQEGVWDIENHCLVCRKGGSLFININLPGCQKLEFEAQTDTPGDITPLLQTDGRDMQSGYFLQFGGYNNTLNKGRRLAEYMTFDQDHMITKGKWHRLVAECDGNHVRLTVDGDRVHDYVEEDEPLCGVGHDRAGIYVYAQARIKNVRVYTRPFQPEPSRTVQSKSTGSVPARDPVTGNLLQGGDGEDPAMFIKWGGPVTRTTNDAHSGVAALQVARITMASGPGRAAIDRTKRYELSGWFKSANLRQPSRVLLDLRYYTADRRMIDNWAIQPATTTSTLLTDAPAGTNMLRVKKRDWPADNKGGRLGLRVALNAHEDLSDLPNFETIPVTGFEEKESCYEIALSKPLELALATGTGVRLHRYLDFPRIWNNHVPTEWTRYAFTVADKPAPGARIQNQNQNRIWPGVAYASVVIFNMYSHYPDPLPDGETPPILLFDDVMFREVGPDPENARRPDLARETGALSGK